MSPPSSRPSTRPGPLFAVGELVGGVYEVRGLLGSGGMSQVFDAHDRRLGRKVAVKVVLPGIDPESLRLEGRALAAIDHPSVVTVHASGVHGGVDYLVLERVPGLSLADYIDRRKERAEPFTIVEALDLLIAIAEGLAVVHRAGLTHRDIKPGNIMLAPGNRVVLMDFGLTLPSIDTLDQDEVVGSMDYMAPEAFLGQVRSESAPMLDLYALGVIAFELLAGFVPFAAPNVAAMVAQQQEPPNVTDHRAAVPQRLAALIKELLAFHPSDRPPMAEAVLWRLRNIRERERTAAPEERFTVLIVDDDEDIHKRLAAYVRMVIQDADVETAVSGRQALRAVRRRVPNMILLDLDLPDVNGLEVCMYVRGMSVADRCMVVAVSGRATEADVQLLDQFGASFIRKGPKLMEELMLLLDRVRPQAL